MMNDMSAGLSAAEPPGGKPPRVGLRLFVAGFTPRSRNAIEALNQVCRDRPELACQVEVIDIYQQPELAREYQVIAIPTLVRYLPQPKKVLIGDLSRTDRLLACLGVAAT